ncbi:MAG: DUF4126 domain-containing protein [Gemmatimonadetes bacterium]|nr:DUF4126 domain-containing protein [Gemmatimonadota bacterium]
MTDPLWLLLSTCALCVAAGLSLYATLATLGLLALFDLTSLPPRLVGLEAPVVWAPLVALYAIEATLARTDGIDHLADSVHTGIRPIGAALLGAAAVAQLGPDLRWISAAIGGGLALWSHTIRSGLAVILRTSSSSHRANIAATAAEASAVAITAATAAWTRVGTAAAAALIVLSLAWAPILLNAARAGRRAAWAILTYPFHGQAWRGLDALPARFATALEAAAGPGARVNRAAPAVARDLPGLRRFAAGWLTCTSRGAYFLFRDMRRARAVAVPGGQASATPGRLFDVLTVGDPGKIRFLIPKNAPSAESLVGHLSGAAG